MAPEWSGFGRPGSAHQTILLVCASRMFFPMIATNKDYIVAPSHLTNAARSS